MKPSPTPLVVEPYYLFVEQNASEALELHTIGAHLFGALGVGWDHDAHVALQLGTTELSHRASRFAASWASGSPARGSRA